MPQIVYYERADGTICKRVRLSDAELQAELDREHDPDNIAALNDALAKRTAAFQAKGVAEKVNLHGLHFLRGLIGTMTGRIASAYDLANNLDPGATEAELDKIRARRDLLETTLATQEDLQARYAMQLREKKAAEAAAERKANAARVAKISEIRGRRKTRGSS